MPPESAESSAALQRIRANPAFAELRARRGHLSLLLTLAVLALYFGFILLVAFAPELLALRLGGGYITLGIPLGLGVIVSAILLTGFYVWRANREFDALTRAALEGTEP